MVRAADRRIADLIARQPRGEHLPGLCTLGQEHLDAGDLDGALACFDRALRIDQAYLGAWVGRSDALARKNRPGEALGCLQRALDRDATFAPALLLKASILERLGCHAEATEVLARLACLPSARKRASVPPHTTAPPVEAATPSPRPKSSASAMRAIRKASPRALRRVSTPKQPAPRPSMTTRTLGRLRRTKSLVATDEPAPHAASEATLATRSAIPDLDPDLGALLDAERNIAEGRLVEALRIVEPLVKIHADTAALWVLRGLALFALGEAEHAAKSASEAVRCDPTKAAAWKLVSRCALAQKKYIPALDAIERAYGLAPADGEVHRLRGDVLVAADRHVEAMYAYEKAVHHRPDDAEAWLELGKTLRLLRRTNAASDALDKAAGLALESGSDEVYTAASDLLARL